jgi:hypothetical protein
MKFDFLFKLVNFGNKLYPKLLIGWRLAPAVGAIKLIEFPLELLDPPARHLYLHA